MKRLHSTFFVFSILLIFLLFFIAPMDTDLGWHLRYGQYFSETGNFLKINTLTYFMPGYFWSNSYTLYQIFIFLVYRLFGLFGLSFLNSLIFVLAFIFFNKINPKYPKINLILFLVLAFLGRNVFGLGLRAQEFTFLFLIIEFFLLKNSQKENKYLFLLIPLFILWVNFHGAFILGFILVFAYLLNQVLYKNFKKIPATIVFLILSVLSAMINPYGINVYFGVIKLTFNPLNTLVSEWVSPGFIVKIILIGLFILYSYFSIKSKNKNKFFWIIVLSAFLYLSFSAVRNLVLYFLIISLSFIDLKEDLIFKLENSKLLNKFNSLILFYIFLIPLCFQIPKTFDIDFNWESFCRKGYLKYPCKAVDYIKSSNIPGQNVFSYYEWSGFLEWQLPNYKFFIDGRAPAWETTEGIIPNQIYDEIILAEQGYQEKLEKYHTNWLLIPVNSYLDYELQQESNKYWRQIYRDNISVIYVTN